MADVAEQQASDHRIKQVSVFLPNRLGALLSVTRILERFDITLLAVSILEAADHAVARLVMCKPTLAREALVAEGYNVVETDLLGIVLPPGVKLRRLLSVLLSAEINVHYMYPLLTPTKGRNVIAMHVEEPDSAARTLIREGMRVVNQDDLT
jgi:hypothetical protein